MMTTDDARQLADRLDAAVILRVDQGKAARVLREQADEIDRLRLTIEARDVMIDRLNAEVEKKNAAIAKYLASEKFYDSDEWRALTEQEDR